MKVYEVVATYFAEGCQAPIYKLDNGDILYPYKNNWLCEDDLIDCITEGKRTHEYEDDLNEYNQLISLMKRTPTYYSQYF